MIQTKECIEVMMTREGFTKIAIFMTLSAGVLVIGCGHMSHIVKMHYFFKNLLLYNQAYIRQTKSIAGVLMLGHGHISNFSEYVLSSTLSIYSTLIAIVLRDYDAAFRYHS